MLDLKITNGTIVDGTGAPRFTGDVGVKDGMVVAIGKVDDPARQTIDATGKIVSPGFIDVHTHYDAQVFWDPALSPSCFHGVTTVFGGFCGFTIAPLTKESGAYLMPMLARVEGMSLDTLKAGVPWNWTSFAEYLSRFDGTLGINAGFLVGHSAIRRYVMGPRAVTDKATAAEIAQMKDLIRESIRGGAVGFSSSLGANHTDADNMPVPSRVASREEMCELFSVVGEFEGTMAEISPPDHFTEDTYEILSAISLAAKRPVNWNALAVLTLSEKEKSGNEAKLRASDYARERGATITVLTLPNNASVYLNMVTGYMLDAIPGWAPFFHLPLAERIAKLRDPAVRADLKHRADTMPDPQARHYATFKVSETFADANKRYLGRLISDIAAEEGRDAFDVFCDIALADDLRTSFSPVFPKETLEMYKERAKLWHDPRTVVGGSDAGAHLDMINTFAVATSLLANGVREYGVITLERAVCELTMKPAELMGLKQRGQLKQGWHADIVIFDADKIAPGKEYTKYDLPANGRRLYSDAIGIHHVVVNGREIVRDGKYLGTPAGTILRPGRDTYTVGIPGPANRAA
jgi:N-acyl-D-aspartate/D-glutamate deacylase